MSKSVTFEFRRSISKAEPYLSDRYHMAAENLGKYLESMAVDLTEWYDAPSGYGYLKVTFTSACMQSERERILKPLTDRWTAGGDIPPSAVRVTKPECEVADGGAQTVKVPSNFDDLLKQAIQGIQPSKAAQQTFNQIFSSGGFTKPSGPATFTPWAASASTPFQVGTVAWVRDQIQQHKDRYNGVNQTHRGDA